MGIKIGPSIIFLGTGGDSFVIGRQLRSSGGIILQSGETQIHIDPGAGALVKAADYGVNIRANDAVLVSHNHLNHANDINAVINAMTYNGFDKRGVLVANKTVINGDEGYQPFLLNRYKNFLEKYIVLEAGRKAGINDIEVQALKARHSEPNAIGFKFFTPQFVLSYSADTKYSAELIDEYKNSNILILNVLSKKKQDDNLSIEDAAKIIKAVSPRLAIIHHFGIDMINADPLYEARELQKETKVQVIAAKDGMMINPLSYAVQQGQRTLFSYSKSETPNVDVKEI